MKAFVTGSTGMVGSNLVPLLLAQGYEVVALVRSLDKAQSVLGQPTGLTFVQGDMQAIEQFESRLSGCDLLFHSAAYFREYYGLGDHWPKLKRINIEGTIHLLEAAERAGVKKVIYVSTSGCLGLSANGSPTTELTPPSQFNYDNLYFKSKIMAEEAIDAFLKTHALPVVFILPGGIFGPSDAAPSESGLFVLNFLKGKVPFILSGGFSVVDARDVAAAMISAVERGRSGDRYLVGGQYTPIEQIVQVLSQVSNQSPPKLKLPGFAMKIFAQLLTWVGKLTGNKPELSPDVVEIMLAQQTFDSAKAKQTLGVSFRPLIETLRDTVRWYQENHYV